MLLQLYLFLFISLVTGEQNATSVEPLNITVKQQINIKNDTSDDTIKKFDDFRPSPQFGGFGDSFLNQQPKSFDVPVANNWSWARNSEKFDETSIEAPWRYSKVKFPAPTEARPYINDYTEKPPTVANPIGYNYEKPPTLASPIDLSYKPPSIQTFPPSKPTILTAKPPEAKSFFTDRSPHIDHSSYNGVNHLDHNSFQYTDQYHEPYHGNSLDHYNHGYYGPIEPHGGRINPWKKILKVLATIIPLGLLLSALTPTIITVTPMNDTENRYYRKTDGTEFGMKKLINSLDTLKETGCEQKVFCELMVNAMLSKNAEEHIKNLLDNFVKGSGIDETSFTNVLEAVKNRNCSPIICKDLKYPT